MIESNEESISQYEKIPSQPLRISTRIRTFPRKDDDFETRRTSGNYCHFKFIFSIDCEPTCFEEDASYDQWKDAMQKEYYALIKNDTWRLLDAPVGIKPIG